MALQLPDRDVAEIDGAHARATAPWRSSLVEVLEARALSRIAALTSLLFFGSGCWEQWSEEWFPQMKWQKAVQAFEEPWTPFEGQVPEGFGPARGHRAHRRRRGPWLERDRQPRSPTRSQNPRP